MKVIIVELGKQTDDVHSELMTWAQGLGVNTKKTTAKFVLAQDADGQWSAHFSTKRGPDGRDLIRPGTNRLEIDYGNAVYPLSQASWPTWFGQPEDVPEMSIPAMLELLEVADSFRVQKRQDSYRRREMGHGA